MTIETLTFGCRLNAYESEVVKAEAEKAGLADALIVNTCAVTAEAVRQAKQSIRKARRDNRSARSSSRLRRADRGAQFRRHGRGRSRHRQRRQDEGRELQADGLRRAAQRQGAGQRHHGRARAGRAPDRGDGRPRPRVRAGAERLRPPLHLLHHPLWPGPVTLGADGRRGRADPEARRQRLPRGGTDRRRHNKLWTRSARHADPRQAGAGDPPPRPRPAAPAHLFHRFHRGGPGTL